MTTDNPHRVTLWWSEWHAAAEETGYSGEDIWHCTCGWRDDDDCAVAYGPSDRAVVHAALTGGTIRFPDPATGWHDYPGGSRVTSRILNCRSREHTGRRISENVRF